MARAKTSRSKSRPITAATDSTRSASGPSRPTRAPITSRTLSGKAICSRVSARPTARSASWEIAPVSDRWRSTSLTKNGLPSVSRYTACGESHRGVVERVTGGGFHERDHAGVVEPRQLDARDAVLAMQRSQRLEEGMRARQLTVAVGPQHQHPHRLLGRDQVTQAAAGWPCPPTASRRARARPADARDAIANSPTTAAKSR